MSTNKNDANQKGKFPIAGQRNSLSSANKKVVTFNQTLISSQDNQSSEQQSKSSKQKKKQSTVSKRSSIDEINSDKLRSNVSQRVTSQQKNSRPLSKGVVDSISSQNRDKKSAVSGKAELDSRTLHLNEDQNGSLNIKKSIQSPNGSSQKDLDSTFHQAKASIASSVEINQSINSQQIAQSGLMPQNNYEDLQVNPELTEPKFDLILPIPVETVNLNELISDDILEDILSKKRQNRKKRMTKRAEKLNKLKEAQNDDDGKHDLIMEDKSINQLAKVDDQNIEEQPDIDMEQNSNLSVQIQQNSQDALPDEMDLIKDEIGDQTLMSDEQKYKSEEENEYEKEAFDSEKEVLAQSQISVQNDSQVNAPTVSILKVPMSSNNQEKGQEVEQPASGASIQKQISLKSKKTVCISEEPEQILKEKRVSEKKPFEVSIESAESFQEDDEAPKTKDGNSIISEEDSAFEDQTPANRDNQIKNFSSEYDIVKIDQQVKKRVATKEQKRKRSLNNTQKSSSNHDNVINLSNDMYKQATKRQQTLQNNVKNSSETKSPLRHHQADNSVKSKGVLSQFDQESMQSRKNRKGVKTTYLSSNQKDLQGSSYGGDFNQKFQKQATQDINDKRGRQKNRTRRDPHDLKGSRDTSLNLTVDNQMDHLSVNFGMKHQNQNFSIEKGEEKLKQGTYSVISSQYEKTRIDRKRKSSFKVDVNSKKSEYSYIQGSTNRKYKSNKRAASKGPGENNISFSFRSKDSIDHKSQSIGPETSYHFKTQKSVKINQNEDEIEFDVRQHIQRANKKMVNVYLQKPYKVLSIHQIRQKEKEQVNASPARLYQAENILKVHTPFRKPSRDQQKTNVFHQARVNDSRNGRHNQKSLSKDSKQSKVMVYNITWRSNGDQQNEDYVGSDINASPENSAGLNIKTEDSIMNTGVKNKLNTNVENTNREQLNVNTSTEGTMVDGQNEKKQLKENSSYSQLSDVKLNQNSAFQNSSSHQDQYQASGLPSNLDQVREMIYARGHESNASLKTENSNEREFWLSLYDQLLHQLDKRIEVVHNQISFHSKTKDLCNIYGQTFTSINFGNASYSPNLSKFEHLGPLKNKSKNYAKGLSRNTNINADLLQPLLAISKDNLNENTISPKNNKESNNTDTALNTFSEELSNKTPAIKISKLNLQGMTGVDNQYQSDKIQSSKINLDAKDMALPLSPPIPDRINKNLQEFEDDNINPAEITALVNSGDAAIAETEGSSWFQKGPKIHKSDGGSRMEEYSKSAEPDLLKLLLQNTDRMGYSFQQLRHLKEKAEQLQKAEKVLNRQIKLKEASKTKTQSVDFKNYPILQMNGEFYDMGQKDIKSFYPEPKNASSVKKEGKNKSIHSNLQLNKQLYANKLNEHMMPKNSFITQKLNNQMTNKVLTSKQSPRNYLADSGKKANETETVEDYFGNKVNLRRSIELKMHYDAKGFKKSGVQNRNALLQGYQTNESVQMDSQDMRAITVSKINKLGSDSKNARASHSFVTSNKLGKTTNFIQENKNHLLPGQILSQLERNRAALPVINKNRSTARKSQKNSEFLKNSSYNLEGRFIDSEDNIYTASNFSSRKNISGSQVPPYQKLKDQSLLSPLKEEISPIRNQRNRFIEENQMRSKKRLIQSGQHVLGKVNNVNVNNSGVKLDQTNGSTSNTQLNHQFKNVSPRLPQFKNNLNKNMNDQNYDLDQAIVQMNQIHTNMKNTSQISNQLQSTGAGISSSQYGLPTRFNHTKQSQILQGFLNQQRIFNRMINNAGVQQRSNNGSKIGMVTGYTSNDASEASQALLQKIENNLDNSNARNNSSMGYHTSTQSPAMNQGFISESRHKLYNNTQVNMGNELAEDVQGEQDRSPNENFNRQRISNTQIQSNEIADSLIQLNQNQAQPGQ